MKDNANTKAIPVQGIVRNRTKIGVEDGQAEDLINLRFVDGSWRTSGDGRLVHTMSGTQYTQLYIHTNVYRHLLGVNPSDNKLYWFANIADDGVTFTELSTPVAITSVSGDLWITQTGHLITIIDESKFTYAVFITSNNEYRTMSADTNGKQNDRNIYPFSQVHVNVMTDDTDEYAYSEKDEDQVVLRDSSDINYNDSSACIKNRTEAERLAARQIWHAQMLKTFEKATEDNRITGAIMVLVAPKLYDGSYAFASNPIFINPREKYSMDGTRATIHNGNILDTTHTEDYPIIGNPLSPTISHYKILDKSKYVESGTTNTISNTSKLPVYTAGVSCRHVYYDETQTSPGNFRIYSNPLETVVRGYDLVLSLGDISHLLENKDIFTGLGVFITRQVHPFDMSSDGYKDGSIYYTWGYGGTNPEGSHVWDLVAEVTYFPKRKTAPEFINELTHSPFFLLRDYNINELGNLQNNSIKVDLTATEHKYVLKNIEQQYRLDIEAFERKTYFPKVTYQYNDRLHIADYKATQFFGFPIDLFHLHNHIVEIQEDSWYPSSTYKVLPNLADGDDNSLQYPHSMELITYYSGLVSDNAPYFIVKTYIETSSGEQIVSRCIKAYNPSPAENGRADFIEDLNPLLTYPDARAKKMEIYYVYNYTSVGSGEVYVKWKQFDLKPHSYLNIAYYIDPDLKPIKLSDFDNYTRET